MKSRFFATVAAIFVVLSMVFLLVSRNDSAYRLGILEAANGLMAVICCFSYLLVNRNITDNPHAFVRGVYSASLLKLMVCMFAVLIYVAVYRSQVHKPTVFVMFGIYIVYTGLETYVLSGLARTRKGK